MNTVLTAVVVAAVYAALETWAQLFAAPRWQTRGIHGIHPTPHITRWFVTASAASAAVAGIWAWKHGTLAAVTAVAAAWLTVVVLRTDLASKKIPAGACWVVLAVTATCAVIAYPLTRVITEGALAMLVVLAAAALAVTRKFGGGDVRLLAALLPLSVFTSATVFAVGILVAVAGQLAYRAIRRIPHSKRLPFGPALALGVVTCSTVAVAVG